jgi:hypothetical protein
VDAFALWTSGGQSETENFSDEAPDFGEFLAEPRSSVATDHSFAEVRASHSSRLLALEIQVTGSAAAEAGSELVTQGCTAGGAANSRFEFHFELSEATRFRMVGNLAADAASASVELIGPLGTYFLWARDEGVEPIGLTGSLEAGNYTLTTRVVASCVAEEIEHCQSSGSLDARLLLGEAATPVQASSFAALKAIYD